MTSRISGLARKLSKAWDLADNILILPVRLWASRKSFKDLKNCLQDSELVGNHSRTMDYYDLAWNPSQNSNLASNCEIVKNPESLESLLLELLCSHFSRHHKLKQKMRWECKFLGGTNSWDIHSFMLWKNCTLIKLKSVISRTYRVMLVSWRNLPKVLSELGTEQWVWWIKMIC